jgi:hypothetical protein
VALCGCHNAPPPADAPPRLAGAVDFSRPEQASQIDSGLYDVENHSWRWTAKKFVVRLGAPPGARGGVLKLAGAVPDPVIAANKTITLSCGVNGNLLPPETFTKAGDFTVVRDVPPLSGTAVVECSVDKTLPPGADRRELGLIVKGLKLDAK